MSGLEQKPYREKIIHIIPLGFEIDRAVKPFEGTDGFRANRVHILSAIESDGTPEHFVERHRKYVEIVKNRLESFGIEVVIHNVLLIDILEVMKKVSSIILNEKNEGNIVYLNMSAAGRLTSVGATIAGMVHNVKVYYIISNGYSESENELETHGYTIVSVPKTQIFENFQIILPDEISLRVLVELFKREVMRTIDIIHYLSELNIPGYNVDYYNLRRNEKTAVIMRLNRNVLDKMEALGYIVKKKIGRENEVELTESGRYIACVSGLLE